MTPFSRTERVLGEEAMTRLSKARVAVFGIGGVGGYVAEALVRSGIGKIDIVDNDTVSVSNINRQVIALCDTVGRPKVEVMRERLSAISPKVEIAIHNCFVLPENVSNFAFEQYDYVVDAMDTVAAKIAVICRCVELGVPVISCMGTGNKVYPERLQLADLAKTTVCPLARVMRKELGLRGIKHIPVVFSTEAPREPYGEIAEQTVRRSVPGSTAFVPATAGFILAGKVVRDIAKTEE